MFRERHGVGCCLEDSCDHSGGTGVLLIMVLKETRVYMRDGEKKGGWKATFQWKSIREDIRCRLQNELSNTDSCTTEHIRADSILQREGDGDEDERDAATDSPHPLRMRQNHRPALSHCRYMDTLRDDVTNKYPVISFACFTSLMSRVMVLHTESCMPSHLNAHSHWTTCLVKHDSDFVLFDRRCLL